MKNFIVMIVCVSALFFSACQDFFDLGEEEITPKGQNMLQGHGATTMQFDNEEGNVAVSIYKDRERENKVADIEPRDETKPLDPPSFVPGTSTNFFVTYTLFVRGVQISYTPPGTRGQFSYLIKENEVNQINVPKITDSPDGTPVDTTAPLINNCYYLSIENTTSYSLKLQQGVITIPAVTGEQSVNSRSTGIYELTEGTNYEVLYNNTTPFPLLTALRAATGVPTDNFQNGNVYEFQMTSPTVTLTLKSNGVTLINIDNIDASIALPPAQGGGSGTKLENGIWEETTLKPDTIDLYWFTVERGKTYYIQWNDSYNGDYTKTADIKVSAHTANDELIFAPEDNGYTYARSITPAFSGTVKIKAEGYTYYSSGTYAVRFYAN